MDLFEMVVQGLITLFFAGVGSYVMWKIAGPAVVVRAIQAKMGPILMEWLVNPGISTGRKRKIQAVPAEFDDKGKEISPAVFEDQDEILSPLELIITKAGDTLFQKVYGKIGGDARKRQAVQNDIAVGLAEPGNPFGSLLAGINPRLLDRALRDGDYVPILIEQFGPLLKQFVENKLSNGNNGSGF